MAEKAVWHDVLTAIVEGDSAPKEIAAIALKTLDIPFSRWST